MSSTILLPNYNNERVLPYTFEALRKNIDCSKYNFLMVDDGSEDNGVEIAKKELKKTGFREHNIIEVSHQGIVSALNIGINEISTEYIIRIDGDATVETANWIEKLIASLKHKEIGMVGGHVIWETGKVHSFGRNIFNEYGLYDVGCCPLEAAGKRTFDSITYQPRQIFTNGPIYEVDSMLGVCVAFRKSDAVAVNKFDPVFNPVWIEDDDFGVQIRLIEKKIL